MNGQRCTAGSRLLVQRPLYDRDRRGGRRARAQHPRRRPVRPAHRARPAHPPGAPRRASSDYIDSARAQGARVLAGGERPRAAMPDGNFLAATVIADVDETMRGLPGGDLRARARGDAVRRRGRGDPAGQRHRVRPRRLRLDERHQARPPRRPRDRHRHVLDQLAERPRPAHAVRRRQGQRASAARAATTRSTSTARPRSCTSRSARTHIPRLGLPTTTEEDAVSATVAQRAARDGPPARRRSTSCASAYGELQVRDLDASRALLRRSARAAAERPRRRRALPARLGGAPAPLARAAPGRPARPSSGSAFRVRTDARPRPARRLVRGAWA